jgi:hypothetical protein
VYLVESAGTSINRQRNSGGKNAKVINTVQMVGMGMRIEHCIYLRDSRGQSLQSKLRRRVNQYTFALRAFNKKRCPRAFIFGVA